MKVFYLLFVIVFFQVQARSDPLSLDNLKISKKSAFAAYQAEGNRLKKERAIASQVGNLRDLSTSCYRDAGTCLPWGEICYFGAVIKEDQNDCPNPYTHMCCLKRPRGAV